MQLDRLGELIRQKRRTERLSLEDAAKQSEVSAATLSRWERYPSDDEGMKRLPSTPDMLTLTRLSRWLNVPLETFLDDVADDASIGRTGPVPATTPDVVEAHLRADRHLDPEDAAALGRIFRLAYEQAIKREAE